MAWPSPYREPPRNQLKAGGMAWKRDPQTVVWTGSVPVQQNRAAEVETVSPAAPVVVKSSPAVLAPAVWRT